MLDVSHQLAETAEDRRDEALRAISYTMTVTDPATFTAPLELKRSWVWRPGETVKPYNCTERRGRS